MGDDVSPLAGVRYEPRAQVLWRWVDAPQDAVVADFVAGQAGLDDPARARLRAGLSVEDLHTLVTFARRAALAALRTREESVVRSAFEALAAIELDRVLDWRDVCWAAALASYAAQRLGLGESAAVAAASRAEPEVGEILLDMISEEVDLRADWGMREADTAGGVVLFEDGGEDYAPDFDLAAAALDVAAMLEGDRYPHSEVAVAAGSLDAWLDEDNAEAALRSLTGVASVHAQPPPEADDRVGHFLLVFLAEAASAGDAEAIAAAAGTARDERTARLGVAVDRRCAVLVARAVMEGVEPLENEHSLTRFQSRIIDLLH